MIVQVWNVSSETFLEQNETEKMIASYTTMGQNRHLPTFIQEAVIKSSACIKKSDTEAEVKAKVIDFTFKLPSYITYL